MEKIDFGAKDQIHPITHMKSTRSYAEDHKHAVKRQHLCWGAYCGVSKYDLISHLQAAGNTVTAIIYLSLCPLLAYPSTYPTFSPSFSFLYPSSIYMFPSSFLCPALFLSFHTCFPVCNSQTKKKKVSKQAYELVNETNIAAESVKSDSKSTKHDRKHSGKE